MRETIEKIKNRVISICSVDKRVREGVRIGNENLWAQIFNDTITNSLWLQNKSFSPGRWAVGYPMLYVMYRVLTGIKPTSILEFGLGESTKMTYQYKQWQSNASLCVIEQDKNWLTFFSEETFDVRPYVKLLDIKKAVSRNAKDVFVYDDLLSCIDDNKYDLIIVDGPWGSKRNSRPQIIDIVNKDLLKEEFVILMDDYDRKGERDTVALLIQVLESKNVDYHFGTYSGIKELAIICSSKYKFLTSL